MAKFLPVCEPLLAGNELAYVTEAVSTGWISSAGKYVKAFEEAFAQYCGVKHGIAVCNGTVALHLALVALGVGKGDEVIIPDFTMMASALAVCYTGAMPVFVDADADTWNISPAAVAAKISPVVRLPSKRMKAERCRELRLPWRCLSASWPAGVLTRTMSLLVVSDGGEGRKAITRKPESHVLAPLHIGVYT